MRISANVSERAMEPPDIGISVVILALDPPDTTRATDVGKTNEGTGNGRNESGKNESGARPTLRIPLVRRVREPFLGLWALPGSPLRQGMSLEDAACDALRSTTGFDPRYLEQLYAFGDPGRSSSALPMVSIAYWALIGQEEASHVHEAPNVRWFPINDLPRLAFDHDRIIDYAMERARARIGTSDIATRLVGERFTLSQLRHVHEAILDRSLNPPNFRRSILASGMIEPTGEVLARGRHRPASLYRYAAPGASPSRHGKQHA